MECCSAVTSYFIQFITPTNKELLTVENRDDPSVQGIVLVQSLYQYYQVMLAG